MFSKKSLPLIIGFAIPLLMIVVIAASVYIPGLFSQPTYNFLYASGANYYNEHVYIVNNGRVAKNPQPTPTDPNYKLDPTPQLYIHNVTTNQSTPITFEEASKIPLDPSNESPDGYKIARGNNSDSFLFFGSYDRDSNMHYIVGHNVSKKLNVKTVGIDYYNPIQFLGWINQ